MDNNFPCKYKYTKEQLREIGNSILIGRIPKLPNNQKIIKYPELEPIRKYLDIFQKHYYGTNVLHLEKLINILLSYQDELAKIDIDFIKVLLINDLSLLCVPTENAIESLIILLDKNKIEFNQSYLTGINTIMKSISSYDKMFNHEIFKYVIEAYNTYYEYYNKQNYLDDFDNIQYNVIRFKDFIVGYTYYYSKDPSIIREFLLKFIDNYEIVINRCFLNNMNHKKDLWHTGSEINMEYADNIVNYVLSLNGNRKVIL